MSLPPLPPVGLTLMRDLWIPLLGQQRIQVTMIGPSTTRIMLHGFITLTDTAELVPNDKGGVHALLSPQTRRALKRVNARLCDVGYDAHRGAAWLSVRGPLPFLPPQRVHLWPVEGLVRGA